MAEPTFDMCEDCGGDCGPGHMPDFCTSPTRLRTQLAAARAACEIAEREGLRKAVAWLERTDKWMTARQMRTAFNLDDKNTQTTGETDD